MKKILPLLLLAVFLSACAAPTVESAAEPAQVIPPSPTVMPSPTSTVIPPTVSPTEGFPTFTPPTVEAGQPTEIRFPANGTYADVTDNIVAGGSKTYSLNAMQGQVMSVSILPQANAASTVSDANQRRGRKQSSARSQPMSNACSGAECCPPRRTISSPSRPTARDCSM